MSYARLQASLEALTSQAAQEFPGADLGVVVCEPDGTFAAGIKPDERFEALSLGKLGIVLAAHRLSIDPETVCVVTQGDVREGGPLAHFAGEEITIREAIAEALVVSGNTGPQIITRASGGPARINRALGEGFKVSGLRTSEGSKTFAPGMQRYTHGLTTAREAARMFCALLTENGEAARLLALSDDTNGLRRHVDTTWGDGRRPINTTHPAESFMQELERQAASGTQQPLGLVLYKILYPRWEPGDYPSKAGIDDDPLTGISARHDVAKIGGLVVATLSAYPYNEQNPGFDLGKGHPAHDFQAAVGRAVREA